MNTKLWKVEILIQDTWDKPEEEIDYITNAVGADILKMELMESIDLPPGLDVRDIKVTLQ